MLSKKLFLRAASAAILLTAISSITGCMSSCNTTKNVDLAKGAVSRFHSLLDSEQYHAIYAEADERFRQAGSEADMNAFFQAVHRKLGRAKDMQLQNTGVQWYAGQGSFVSLTYQTQFSDASGTEHFIWHIADGHAILVGYNINSNALILK